MIFVSLYFSVALELFRGCLVCDFKQPFSVFKKHFTHFNGLFHPHVFPQIFSNNNFQFLNTYTNLSVLSYVLVLYFFSHFRVSFFGKVECIKFLHFTMSCNNIVVITTDYLVSIFSKCCRKMGSIAFS